MFNHHYKLYKKKEANINYEKNLILVLKLLKVFSINSFFYIFYLNTKKVSEIHLHFYFISTNINGHWKRDLNVE